MAEQAPQRPKGIPFKQMTPTQKTVFVLKVICSVLTFGMAFPNVMSD